MIRKIASIYSIIIGLAILIMWITFIITNQVPEINTAPIKISYHLIAEFLTAFLLLIGGYGLLTKQVWGFHLHLISLGTLLYTVIVSTGYYANLGDMIMVGMFTLFQILTLIFIGLTFYKHHEYKN